MSSSPSTTQAVAGVVESHREVAESCIEFLYMEMVNYVLRTTISTPGVPITSPQNIPTVSNRENTAVINLLEESPKQAGNQIKAEKPGDKPLPKIPPAKSMPILPQSSKTENLPLVMDPSLTNDAIIVKLEMMGFRVGQRLIERIAKDVPRFPDTLEIIKFLAKEMWSKLFRKNVDKLRTNNKGTYELQDSKFKWLNHLSIPPETKDIESKNLLSLRYVYFFCGVIRGALANLEVFSRVKATINTESPQCVVFTLTIKNVN